MSLPTPDAPVVRTAAVHNAAVQNAAAVTESSGSTWPAVLTTGLALVLLGLAAGFFVTYTISVTRGLAVVDDQTYVQAFQAINARVQTFQFAAFFFGAIPVTAVAAFLTRGTPTGWLLLGALGLYLLGVSAVTFVGNLPLNDQLATYTHLTPDLADQARAAFESRWNSLNRLRALSSIGSFGLATAALVMLPKVVR